MSLEQIIAELKKDLNDESTDHDKYMKLADAICEKFPHRGYDGILKDIAYEEGIHRKHIECILKDLGVFDEQSK